VILGTILGISFVILLINGLFVAAEFALIGASRPTLERDAAAGDRLAHRLLQVVSTTRRQDRYIATAQLGITVASLGLGMYGEHALADYLYANIPALAPLGGAAAATGIALLVLTVGHIVIGEMIPKALALQNPIRVGKWAYWPMYVSLMAFYPLVVSLNAIANASLALFGVRRQANAHEQLYTPEELQMIVEESEKGGQLLGESGKILQELFEFGDLTASQAMVPRVKVVGIPLDATPEELRRIARMHRRTRYPVYDRDLDHIIGLVHARDLLQCMLRDEPLTAARVRRIPVVPETATLDSVLATMQQTTAHLALVVDEHGGTGGIISLEDLFEEVVGEIDEGRPAAPEIELRDDGSVRAAGTVRLETLGQQLGIELEHDEVDSVSGLVMAQLDRLPAVGDVVEYERVRLEVTATSGRGVSEARVWLLGEESSMGGNRHRDE
jgi:CBS domain containing-hemolysin-like protein